LLTERSLADPLRERISSGIRVSPPGTFNKTKLRSALGKISKSELKTFSRISFRSRVLPSS